VRNVYKQLSKRSLPSTGLSVDREGLDIGVDHVGPPFRGIGASSATPKRASRAAKGSRLLIFLIVGC